MDTAIDAGLLALLQLTDSLLPIGAFAHSGGLETLVQENAVRDAATATEYLHGVLRNVMQYGDALALRLSYEAAAENDIHMIRSIDERLCASKVPYENKAGSAKMCTSFLKLATRFIDSKILLQYSRLIADGECRGQHCIAYGISMAAQGVGVREALAAYLYNQASGIVTNCVKLVPLSQISGQEILFGSQRIIIEIVRDLSELSFEDLGRGAIGFDIAAMRHEDLESRLYMS